MSRDALVVGINTYDHLKGLIAPAADAEAIAQRLEQYGEFKVTRLPAVKDKPNNTIRIGQQTKVTLTQFKKSIVQLFKPEGGHISDTALLYFSGHGLREGLGIEEGFLATSDVNPEDSKWGLSLQWLRRLLLESEVRQQIIILDCCYSGEMLNFAEADPGDRGRGRDRCFIAASRAYEVAYEEIDSKHSVLTNVLLKGLEPKQEQWVTNYALIDFLNQQGNSFPQRPIFANSGELINLTRRRTLSTLDPTAKSEQAICPYKGLAYFDCTEEDTKYFYGRTALTDQLLEKVNTSNFLAILGASGSGKSSVVRAGLLYQLKLGQRLSGSNSWQIRILKPAEHPLQSLALAFIDPGLSDIDRADQLAKAEQLIANGAVGLEKLINVADTKRVVLVVDQLEEAFTLCQDIKERQQFFECLLGVVKKISNKLCLVLTMRSDFFGKCTEQEYSGLAQEIQQSLVTVTLMTEEELRQVIVQPARQVNLEIEPELVEQMLKDVTNAPGYLPLLQYTLTEMWKQRTDNCLRLNNYAKLGGVTGTLRQRATEVYESFPDETQKSAVRHVFLSLTQLGEGTEDTRRRVWKQDLVNKKYSEELINKVVQRLANEKLIVTETVEKSGISGRVAVVDVAHEALIRNWHLLIEWLNLDRKKLLQMREIEIASEKWREHEKSKDYLLQGKQLNESKAFTKEEYPNFILSDLARDFIQKSIRHKWNNRVKIIGFSFIPIVVLSTYLGFIYERQIRIKQYWAIVDAANGQKDSSARFQALEGLVKTGVPLTNVLLSNAYLYGINLKGTDLSGAHLAGADLRHADLTDTNLNADLSGADLSNAKFKGADLSGANLTGANFSLVQLQDSNLKRISFSHVNLTIANLSGADLSYDNFSDAVLAGTNFKHADLKYANMLNADLLGADLKDANISNAYFIGAKHLTPEQVKSARNWDKAKYDKEFCVQLGLPPECSALSSLSTQDKAVSLQLLIRQMLHKLK